MVGVWILRTLIIAHDGSHPAVPVIAPGPRSSSPLARRNPWPWRGSLRVNREAHSGRRVAQAVIEAHERTATGPFAAPDERGGEL
jgi:hypothetical protein